MKLCLVGGFLGSGKTTAVATAAKLLTGEKIALAVITNDQGSQLVDAAFIRSLNIAGSEVGNGCFCCNYDQFYSSIEGLKASVHPEIIFAEAVGSCADLVATVVKPLNRFHPDISVSLSVFADGPVLLSSVEGRSSFVSEDIQYIYKKQLEEAGLIIINKCDLLTENEIKKIQYTLESEYPGRTLLFQDSRKQASVKTWMNILQGEANGTGLSALSIEYDKYGAGEAALAWLDASIVIHSKQRATVKAYEFINDMVDEISRENFPIGHLKFFLESGEWQTKISYTTAHNENFDASNSEKLADRVHVLVNARLEADPNELKKIFYTAISRIQNQNCHAEILDLASFRPAYPRPTHRVQP